MNLRQFAMDATRLPDVNTAEPFHGAKPVTWGDRPTHVVVTGKATGIPKLARGYGLYPVERLRGGWDVLPSDVASHVTHMLMVAYDETLGWREDDLGMNLAYLAMAMLQGTEPLFYPSLTAQGHPFVVFLRGRFHVTHPLWSFIQNGTGQAKPK